MNDDNKPLVYGGVILLALFIVFSPMMMVLLVAISGAGSSESSEACTSPQTSASSAKSSTSSSAKEADADSEEMINVPEEYKQPIKDAAKESGLPEALIARQNKQESNFDRFAGSPAGAKGPAQFTEETWEAYGNGGDIHDVEDSVAALGRYMKALSEQVAPLANGDKELQVQLTLAAYNAGPGAVEKYKGLPPFSETKHYVETIAKGAQMAFSKDCKQVSGAKAWDGDLGDGEWTNPCPGCAFTSPYGGRNLGNGVDSLNGSFHYGVDLATPGAGMNPGTEIIAPVDMEIVEDYAKDGCVWGKATEGPDFTFGFCHLHSDDVSVGQKLKRGDIIGVEGNTAGTIVESGGAVPATHLHLEIYKPGFDVKNFNWFNDRSGNLDPEPILKEKGSWVK